MRSGRCWVDGPRAFKYVAIPGRCFASILPCAVVGKYLELAFREHHERRVIQGSLRVSPYVGIYVRMCEFIYPASNYLMMPYSLAGRTPGRRTTHGSSNTGFHTA